MTDPAVAKLQALVRIPTVSHRDPALVDGDAFDRFVEELATQFPLLHSRLELTRVSRHGLLFHWPGRASDRPVVLMAHLDVVPVDEEAPWQHPPFSAEIVDGHVWGRGTLDDKGALVAVCEAVERHLEEGLVPGQDVWLSFGCDEEVSGEAARMAVEELRSRGVRPWFVVDEGGAVAHQAFPGVEAPVGVIGVTGTDGKTTTSFLIDHLLRSAGMTTGLIGTVAVRIGDSEDLHATRQTTPESNDMQRYLRAMVEAGAEWATVEATSHGLAMHRLDHIQFQVGAVTNITHEHLDFHGTIDNYRRAKAMLLERVATATGRVVS